MTRTSIAGLFLAMVLATPVACRPTAKVQQAERPRLKLELVSLPLHRPEMADRAALPGLVKGNNAFALGLYHKLRSEPGNILVSPACLTAGLGLLRAGARGETAAEIDRVLHLSGALSDRAWAALVQDLNADGTERCYQIRLANAVWLQQGYPILNAYRTTLGDAFALNDECRIDFVGHPGEAAHAIDRWVAARTGSKITAGIPSAAFTVDTKLAMTTALYFRGNWTQAFQRSETRDAAFHLSRSRSVKVPMMHLYEYVPVHGYLDRDSFQVLSLSCGGGAFAMAVLLPRHVDALGDLEAMLTPELLDALWPRLTMPEQMDISLPRFRVKASRALRPVLEELGVKRPFIREQADFSGINGKSADLYVTAATHDTFLDVNEEGIEASAFTGIIAADGDGDPPPVVTVDHPFFYVVRDTRTGCIVFLGRVLDPTRD